VSEALTGSAKLGEELASNFRQDLAKLKACSAHVSERERPLCVMLEWTEPLFDGGHW
jgi:hypothetical protein